MVRHKSSNPNPSPFAQLFDYQRFSVNTPTKTENFDLSAKRILCFSADTRMNSPLAVDALNIWPSRIHCRMNSGGSSSSRNDEGGDHLVAGEILPPFCDLRGCRDDWLAGGTTASESRRRPGNVGAFLHREFSSNPP